MLGQNHMQVMHNAGRRACDTVLSLVNDNIENKDLFRSLGGIKILVNLLKAQDSKL